MTAPQTVEGRIREAAQFLCDRLADLDWSEGDLLATANDFNGHVDPAISRLRADLAAPVDDGWRPIGEAPKDGTEFLALASNGWYVLASAPVEGVREGWPYQWWRTSNRQSYPVVETHPEGYDWSANHTQLLTHFRPLPAAPAITDGAGS